MKATERTKRQTAAQAIALAVLLAAMAPLRGDDKASPMQLPVAPIPARVAAAPAALAVPPADPAKAELPDPPQPASQPSADGGGAGGRAEPGGLMDRAVDSGAQVYVDDSFAAVEIVRAAIRYDQKDQSQLAIQKYQQAIDEFGQKLIYLNTDSYVSITDYVRARLLAMAAVQRGDYDQFYGLEARKLVDAAIEKQDLAGLVRACDRYFPAAAVVNGLAQAADWYFERGEFAAAARTWTELASHPRAGDRQAEFLHHAILAEKLSGRDGVAKKLRERLAALGDPMGVVGGATVHLLANADEALKQEPWVKSAAAVDEWPMFEGSPSRTATLDVTSQAGSWLWGVELGGDKNKVAAVSAGGGPIIVRGGGAVFVGGTRVGGEGDQTPILSSYPVISNGQLFIHAGDRVLSLSANAGNQLWSYPAQAIPRSEPNPSAYVNVYGYASRMPSHDSCTVYGDQVFAVLPTSAGPPQPRSGIYMGPQTNTRLVCLSRADGREQWSRSSSEVAIAAKGSLVFVGAPLVARQGVFVMARKVGGDAFSQQYLVRLDRDSGVVTWTCYLCSTSSGTYYGYGGMVTSVALPSMADDVVYISTGQGADCAVDANAGRILWLQVTEAAKQTRSAEFYYGNPGPATPSWKFNPPIVHGDKLVTLEAGSMLRVYDRWTGRLISKVPTKSLDNAEILAGVIGKNLVTVGSTVGSKVRMINLDNGKDMLEPVEFPKGNDSLGKLSGRPFLASRVLYLPFEKGLAMVDLETGQLAPALWPKNEKDQPGKPGNLLVTSEQIVVVGDGEVSGYSRWETARDKRLADIEKNPQDPKPRLALAEVAFRTAHWDMAEENMAKSVDLATNPRKQPDGELLGRLYRTNLNFAEQLRLKSDKDLHERARFYYASCKATARDPESNAEWRLSLAPLALDQKKYDEAAVLYSEVLTDSGMRNAPYRLGENMTRAGITAETRFKALIADQGPAIYTKYEDQASALLAKARQQKDVAGLQFVVESYPNSQASLSAAQDVAGAYKDRQDWKDEIKVLRWAYPRLNKPEEKARVTVELAKSLAALQHWDEALRWTDRGRRSSPDLKWAEGGKPMTFAQLRADLQARIPGAIETRRPNLSLPMDELSAGAQVATGFLMVPIEPGAAQRRPDLMLVYHDGIVEGLEAPSMKSKWSCKLDENVPALLLGYSGNVAVVATAHGVTAIDTGKGEMKWAVPLEMTPEEWSRYQQQTSQSRQLMMQQGQMAGINGGLVIMGGDVETFTPNLWQQMAMDSDTARVLQFQQVLGQRGFNTMKIVGNRLLAIAGNRMTAFDMTTGKKVWKSPVALPDGAAEVLVGTDEFIVAQVNSPDRGTPTFVVIEADTGRLHGTIKLEDERVLWRALGEDGSLFLVSDQAVSAYDLHGDLGRPLWKRDDVHTRYPAATSLTLDGLVLVNTSNELVCLPQEGGEARWPQRRLEQAIGPGMLPFIRTIVDGDNVIVQSSVGIEAYQTADGAHMWSSVFVPGTMPPLVSTQLAEPYLVVLGNGPIGTAQRAATLFLINRVNPATGKLDNGKVDLTKPLRRSDRRNDQEGPIIARWDVIDGGIALEINSGVYVYRSASK